MPSPINRVPPGLLSLLDVKSMGVNPVVLGDELQGVFQLTELYVNAIAQTQVGETIGVATTGLYLVNTGYIFQAAPGEILVAEKICAKTKTNIGATSTIKFRICVTGNGGPIIWVGPEVAGGNNELPATYADRPLILMPGHMIGVLVESVINGTVPISVAANVASLRF